MKLFVILVRLEKLDVEGAWFNHLLLQLTDCTFKLDNVLTSMYLIIDAVWEKKILSADICDRLL